MRYRAILGLCFLTLAIFGCSSETQQPATPPAENVKENNAVGKSEEGNGNGDFKLDVDAGQGGVHVETEGPDDKSGVNVDVDPSGEVDVDIGKNASGKSVGSGD